MTKTVDVHRDLLASADIAAAAQLACLLEVSAAKPGNVSPGRHFADACYEEFLASAVAIGGPLAGAGTRPLGATVRLAVEATARWTRSNTNLGIVLLLAPLARAAMLGSRVDDPTDCGMRIADCGSRSEGGGPPWMGLRNAVRRVLEATTVDDARDVYAAIRLAAPGGLGRVAVVETFLTLLAAAPDTHVARRGGAVLAADILRRARAVRAAGGVRSTGGRRALDDMDRSLREAGNVANPGTTADLTAAAIFVVLLGGGWRITEGGGHAATR